MELSLTRYSKSESILWNDFNESAKNGLFFFDRGYLEYHADRFQDHSLLIYRKNKLVAIFPATQNDNEIISHAGLTFGSLILSFDVKTAEVLAILKDVKSYYKNLFFTKITYKCIPHIFNNYPSDEDLYALFREDAKLVRRDISSVIEMNNKIEINNNKKRLNKKCMINNIRITENDQVDDYWELLSEVLQKYDTKPVHNLIEIKSLKNKFFENIKLFEARKDDLLLAGILIFDFGNVVHTQYLASSDEGRKFGALDFISTFLIEKFTDRKYFSFGISTEKQGRVLNEGLIQQKENMGARGVTLDHYEIIL